MERIKVMVLAAFAVIMFPLIGCVPMGSDGTAAPLYETGEMCRAPDMGARIPCPGHDPSAGRCVYQYCDDDPSSPYYREATACTVVPCGDIHPPYVESDASVGCTPAARRDCTTDDRRFGFQLCDVSGNWMMCQPYGDAVDAGTPSMDAGTLDCGGDPLLGTACTVGLGECAASGTYVCDAGVLTCDATAGTPSSEICDNLDNDCDGTTDEAVTRTCYGGPEGTRGVGQCTAGSQVCMAGAWGVCTGEVLPAAEIPDNDVDEDCNGGLLFSVSCGGDSRVGTACRAGVGECLDTGSWSCVGNELLCDATPGDPVSESCDNLDNDCDGAIDESLFRSFYTGPPGTASVGICRLGYDTCVAGAWTLDAPEVTPLAEACGDGIDQDCNGGDLPCLSCGGDTRPGMPCRVGLGECGASGAFVCDMGRIRCDAMPGAAVSESCDAFDNDCDGAIDESLTQTCYSGDMRQAGVGICRMGMRTCSMGSWGACAGEVLPTTEVCGDGIDQDCSGGDLSCASCGGDARIGTSCSVGRGACAASGTWVCVADRAQCNATAGMPSTEVCDGLDNDCDGSTDEGPITRSCYPFTTGLPGVGICRSGSQTCSGGSFGTCSGAVGPSTEVCDGLDNDCDGGADEGGVCSSPGADAGPPSADAGTGMMADAGAGAIDSGVSSTGYATWIDPSIPLSTWCPSGGALEVRVWDNQDDDVPNVNEMHYEPQPLVVPIGPTGLALTGSYGNDTLYCRTGSGTYMGYYSPRLRGATNGATCVSLGVRKYINGAEVPCFICWDTGYAGSTESRSTEFRRTQTRYTPDVSAHTACMTGTLLP